MYLSILKEYATIKGFSLMDSTNDFGEKMVGILTNRETIYWFTEIIPGEGCYYRSEIFSRNTGLATTSPSKLREMDQSIMKTISKNR